MRNLYLFIILLSWSVQSQQQLTGQIKIKENTTESPIEGVNLIWLNTSMGTITDQSGNFKLSMSPNSNKLVISYLGFKTDTLVISSPKILTHTLLPNTDDALDEVTLTERRKAIQKSYLEAQNIIRVSSEELLVALYTDYYAKDPFTHISKQEIALKQVINSNHCFLHLHLHEGTLLITSVIDNLIKGASGQAIQNMNLIFGWEEGLGLNLKASTF